MEEYVTFETAKLLKDKGFDLKCLNLYGKSNNGDFELFKNEFPVDFNNGYYVSYSAPTQQMAARWLRELFNIHCFAFPVRIGNGNILYSSNVYDASIDNFVVPENFSYDTYEKALESAIYFALKKVNVNNNITI